MNQAPRPTPTHSSLGQRLLAAGKITTADLEQALAHRHRVGLRLGQALVDLNMVSSADLTAALMEQGKLTCILLQPELVERDVAHQLGEECSRSKNVVALNCIAGITTVAMEDPADVYTMDELARVLGTKVLAVHADPHRIEECLDAVFNAIETDSDAASFDDIVEMALEGEVDLEAGQGNVEVNESDADLEGPVVSIIQAILKEAFDATASDIHLEPRAETFVVRFRVDGMLSDRMVLKKVWARPCIARIKVMSSLDIAQRRVPQDGRTQVAVGGRTIDLRVSTMPTLLGEGAVIRILDGGRGVQNLEGLGLRKEQERRLCNLIECSDGIVLAAGPTGSGKTTTLYALLDRLNQSDRKIITLEDPVENQIETVCQINTNDKAGLTFARGLRSVLRQDPDVILVGEIRDLETAQISVQAALTGHMVLSTLHTIGAPETITRLREMGVEHYLLSDTLRGIIAQRLLRNICQNCKQPAEVDHPTREYLGVDRQVEFFEGRGCSECGNTGYKGRHGVYEIMAMTPGLADALRSGADVDKIREIAYLDGMTTMRDEGLIHAMNGHTTIKEVLSSTPKSRS